MSSYGSRPTSVSNVGSTATVTSEMSQAYHNRKVIKQLNSWYYGSGKYPFKCAILWFVIGFLILFAGIVLIALVFAQRQLPIGNWIGQFVAAALIVGGILVFALGAKFLFEARKRSTADRKRLAFRPKGLTKVSVVNNAYESDKQSHYKTKSGTSSVKAVNSPYQSSVGTQSRTQSLARTGDSLPSLDNRPISPGYHTGTGNRSQQGRYESPAKPQRRYDDRHYNDHRNHPPSRSVSKDFDDIPLDDHPRPDASYI